jgi:hypothetical protein
VKTKMGKEKFQVSEADYDVIQALSIHMFKFEIDNDGKKLKLLTKKQI